MQRFPLQAGFGSLLFCLVAAGGLLFASCGGDDPGVPGGEQPVDYRAAAAREYQRLLDAWSYQGDEGTFMWYQGNALDTLIDYIAVSRDREKGADLGTRIDTLWAVAEPAGDWWDDFGWWGVAFLNAARNHGLLGKPDAATYLAGAAGCLEDHMDHAARVWDLANAPPCDACIHTPPANWYRYRPRFTGGVWNSAFAGLTPGVQESCNPNNVTPPPHPAIPVGTPGDDCSTLKPLQNTVTNGLYLVLNARYCLQDARAPESRKETALAIYGWFRSWMDVPDAEVLLCSGFKTRPSLLSAETGLVRERAGTYALDTARPLPCFTGVQWYEPETAWAGDQGILLGGLTDMLNSGQTGDGDWLLERARGIIDATLAHMTSAWRGSSRDTLAPGMLRPWARFDGWGPPGVPSVEKSPFAAPGGFGFGDPEYPRPTDPEYHQVCGCDGWKELGDCPAEPPRIPLDASTNYIAGPGIFLRYLLYAHSNSPELRAHIDREEVRSVLRTNADAVAAGTYSCSCKNPIDSGTYDACNLSCQITRLATLNAALGILGPP